MGLLTRIERIRRKPYPYRQRLTLLVAAAMTLCIVFVWFIFTLVDLSPREGRDIASPSGESPFERLGEQWDKLRDSYHGFLGTPAP